MVLRIQKHRGHRKSNGFTVTNIGTDEKGLALLKTILGTYEKAMALLCKAKKPTKKHWLDRESIRTNEKALVFLCERHRSQHLKTLVLQ